MIIPVLAVAQEQTTGKEIQIPAKKVIRAIDNSFIPVTQDAMRKNGGKMVGSVGNFKISLASNKNDNLFGEQVNNDQKSEFQDFSSFSTDENCNADAGKLKKGEYLLIMDPARLSAASKIMQKYGAEGLPEGATFDAPTSEFRWEPGYEDAGEYQVSLIKEKNQLRFKYGAAVYAIILPENKNIEYQIVDNTLKGRALPLIKIIIKNDIDFPPFTFMSVNNYGVDTEGKITEPDKDELTNFLRGD